MTRIRANLLLILTSMIWGSSFVVQQIGTGELGTISFTGARFLVGALVVLPFALRQMQRLILQERRFSASDWFGIMLTGVMLMTAAALQQHGILRTSVTNSGFLTALYIPFKITHMCITAHCKNLEGYLSIIATLYSQVSPATVCNIAAGLYLLSCKEVK